MELLKQLLPFVGGILGGFGVAIVSYFATRGKSNAEAKTIEITGELNITKAYQEYVEIIKKDKNDFRQEMLAKIEELRKEHAEEMKSIITRRDEQILNLEKAGKIKDERIATLEGDVRDLRGIIERYKRTGVAIDEANVQLHKDVDDATKQIKSTQ